MPGAENQIVVRNQHHAALITIPFLDHDIGIVASVLLCLCSWSSFVIVVVSSILEFVTLVNYLQSLVSVVLIM